MKKRTLILTAAVLVIILAAAAFLLIRSGQPRPAQLTWGSGSPTTLPPVIFDAPSHQSMVELREKYGIAEVVAGSADDLTRLVKLTAWTNRQWSHSSSNQPTKQDPLTILAEVKAGRNFRCVEYATVLKGIATAEGMPARSLGLKRRDTATAASGAGHVVVEVWLPDQQKWVFADGQFGYVPVCDGKPLNAVELQQAIIDRDPKLTFLTGDGPATAKKRDSYIRWVAPYLFYFDYQLDQRQYEKEVAGGVMLVPKGAPNLTVFQRNYPLQGFTYISDPALFYRAPDAAPDLGKH